MLHHQSIAILMGSGGRARLFEQSQQEEEKGPRAKTSADDDVQLFRNWERLEILLLLLLLHLIQLWELVSLNLSGPTELVKPR